MKPFKLLIGYDGSECANKALQDMSGAGLPETLDVVVLTVADTWLGEGRVEAGTADWLTKAIHEAEMKHKKLVADARQMAWDAAKALRMRHPTWNIHAKAVADSPAWGLIKFSDAWKPDLIVLGCKGRSAVGRLFIGSVSQKVLTHAIGSVRIVRPQAKEVFPPRIIVGFDGSAGSRRALAQVADRTWPKGTLVELVSVVDQKIALMAIASMSRERQGRGTINPKRLWMSQVIQPALRDFKSTGVKIIPQLLQGGPADALIKEARRWKATGIFVGARGLAAIERFLLGSVSTRLAADAPCPVEVVR